MQRRMFLDYARAVGILAVVWVHVVVRMDPGFGSALSYVSVVLRTTTFLPILFMVSGCLAREYITQEQNSLPDCFRRYAVKILLPFYSLNALFFMVNVMARPVVSGLPSASEMAWSIITMDIGDNLPSGVLWFFFTLFLASMTVSVWVKVIKISPWYLFLAAVVLNVFFAPSLEEYTLLSLNKYSINLCFYVFGVCMSRHIMNMQKNSKKELGMLVGYFIFLGIYLVTEDYPWNRIYFALAAFLGTMLVLHLLFRLEDFSALRLPRALKYIGINSIVIYTFHMPSFKIIKPVLERFHMTASWPGLLIWTALGVALPLAIGQVLSRVPSAYRILFARYPNGA